MNITERMELAKQFGTVIFNRRKYWLSYQAICDNYGTDGAVRYYAPAFDRHGNEYRIAWDTTPEWDAACRIAMLEANSCNTEDEEMELDELRKKYPVLPDCGDESNACDWDHPVAVDAR
jgi:hypothetical protein